MTKKLLKVRFSIVKGFNNKKMLVLFVVIGPIVNSFNDDIKIFIVILVTTKSDIVVIS